MIHHRRFAQWLGVAVCLLLLVMPAAALADAPDTRGPEELPQGSVSTAPVAAASWAGVTIMPAAAGSVPAPMAVPRAQNSSATPLVWIGRKLNVGNWAMDMVLGGASGMFNTISDSIAAAVLSMLGIDQMRLTPDCANSQINFLFCTPSNLVFGASRFGIGQLIDPLWKGLTPIATGIITILFVVRLMRLLTEGRMSLQLEGRELITSFIFVTLGITQARWLFERLFELVNAIHASVFRILDGANPLTLLQFVQASNDLDFGGALALLIFWGVLLVLVIKSFIRIVKLVVLVFPAPIMIALAFDRSTRPRFEAWIGRIGDVLLEQTAWVFFFVAGGLLLRQSMSGDSGDPAQLITMRLSGAIVLGMAIGGEALLAGLVGATGGSLGLATVAGRMVAGVGRSAVNARMLRPVLQSRGALPSRPGATSSMHGSGQTSSMHNAGAHSPAMAAPHLPAPAQRRHPLASPTTPPPARTASASSMALPAQGSTSVTASGTSVWGASAGVAPVSPFDPVLHRQMMRTRAQHAAQFIRQQAHTAHGAGRQALLRRATVHDQIAKTGQVPYKPGRGGMRRADGSFGVTPEQQQVRAVHRQTLLEARGEHGRLRTELDQQVVEDETRLERLPHLANRVREQSNRRVRDAEAHGMPERALAIRQHADHRVAMLEADQHTTEQRLRANRASQAALAIPAGMTVAPLTRQVASQRAQARLASRSHPHPQLKGGLGTVVARASVLPAPPTTRDAPSGSARHFRVTQSHPQSIPPGRTPVTVVRPAAARQRQPPAPSDIARQQLGAMLDPSTRRPR